MFSRQGPIVFDPYAGRRRRRLPRGLLALLAGLLLGAAGHAWLQSQVLPPRLSLAEGRDLQARLDQALAQAAEAEAERAALRQAREAAVAELAGLKAAIGSEGRALEQAQASLEALLEALPPDPRDGEIAVRAARFSLRGGQLAYTLALSQAQATPRPLRLSFIVEGETAAGTRRSLTLKPVLPPPLGRQALLQGSLPWPGGPLQPRLVTVRIQDPAEPEGGEILGMRVLPVR